MKIIRATIVEYKDRGDMVHLETDLPSAYPDCLKGNLTLAFEAEKGKGTEYLCEHFVFTIGVQDNIKYINGENYEWV